jgi:hypothetical protein
MKSIMNTCMAIVTASIIFVSAATAVSPDQRKLGRKNKEKSNVRNCPQPLYFNTIEFFENTQFFVWPKTKTGE